MKAKIILQSDLQGKTSTQVAGMLGNVCQSSASLGEVLHMPMEKAERIGSSVKASGHMSCYCHEHITIGIEGIPKALAILLNSLHFYNTSEKSGRHTVMNQCSEREQELYKKWYTKILSLIQIKYPDMKLKDQEGKAMENARKMVSAFTPTTMVYTTSKQQWNFILDWLYKYEQLSDAPFYSILAEHTKELADILKPLVYEEGLRDNKDNHFEFFNPNTELPRDYFGSVYCANYMASFDHIAQCERHRVLTVNTHFDGNPVHERSRYSIPDILEKQEDREEWLDDILSVADEFPQGLLLHTVERGTFMAWRKSKCLERDCGHAQLEIKKMNQWLHGQFIKNRINLTKEERNLLLQMNACSRCKYPDFTCTYPCYFGPQGNFTRLI